jgi:hypothetical protein
MTRRLATMHLAVQHVWTRLLTGRRDAGLTTVEWLVVAVGAVVAATAAVVFYQTVIQARLNGL